MRRAALHRLRLNLTEVEKKNKNRTSISAGSCRCQQWSFSKTPLGRQSSGVALHVPRINPEELKILLKCSAPTPAGMGGNLLSFPSALRALGLCNVHNMPFALRRISATVWGRGDAHRLCVQRTRSPGRESLCQVWSYFSTVLEKISVPVQNYRALLQRVQEPKTDLYLKLLNSRKIKRNKGKNIFRGKCSF